MSFPYPLTILWIHHRGRLLSQPTYMTVWTFDMYFRRESINDHWWLGCLTLWMCMAYFWVLWVWRICFTNRLIRTNFYELANQTSCEPCNKIVDSVPLHGRQLCKSNVRVTLSLLFPFVLRRLLTLKTVMMRPRHTKMPYWNADDMHECTVTVGKCFPRKHISST